MPSKFEQEKGRVALLMQRLGILPTEYQDPQPAGHAREETGADVAAVVDGRRIGIQVTDLDTGDVPGEARSAEARLARNAEGRGGVYATWAQNQPDMMFAAVARSVARKSRMSFAGFEEFWLLICCGTPQPAAIASTFLVTPSLDVGKLDALTAATLVASKYSRVFLYAILGIEERALYQWQRGGTWSKSVLALALEERGPSFWDYRSDPELLRDPDGWCDREIARYFAERRARE
jgi:hypothetical protein